VTPVRTTLTQHAFARPSLSGVLVALLATLVSLAPPRARAAEPAGRIRVLPQATVGGPVVRLEDVAALDGTAIDFADAELAAAPEAGASRRVSGQTVLAKLRQAGVGDEIAYTIPAIVTVTRAHQTLGEGELRPAIEERLAKALAPGDRLEAVEVARPARVPLGAYELEVGAPSAGTGGGFRRVDVRVVQDGATVATVPARVKIASFGPVVVTRQPIGRGDVLREEDLRVEERRLDELPGTVVSDLEHAIGKEARVALAAGRPLTVQALASAALVKRGDAVRVTIDGGGLRLSVAGEALETAGAGERVRVLNAVSRRELTGRVVDHGTVHVVY